MKTIIKILTILTLLTKEKKKVAKKKRKVTAAMVTFNYDVTGCNYCGFNTNYKIRQGVCGNYVNLNKGFVIIFKSYFIFCIK